MRPLLLILLSLLTWLPTAASEPDYISSRLVDDTSEPLLDSLLAALNQQTEDFETSGLGRLSVEVYMKGSSQCTSRGHGYRYLRNVLPFEVSDSLSVFEAVAQASYIYPYQLQFDVLDSRSSSRHGRRYLREAFQVILPYYNVARPRTNGGRNTYVVPFSDDGMKQYAYRLRDSIYLDGRRYYWLEFTPRHKHHSLITGYVSIAADDLRMHSLTFSGLIDFGQADVTLQYGEFDGQQVIARSHISLKYNYAGTSGINEYDCFYTYRQLWSRPYLKLMHVSHDLTDVYSKNADTVTLDAVRPAPLPAAFEERLSATKPAAGHRRRKFYQTLPEFLVSSSRFDAFGSNLKVYGPLEPAAFGYDHLNGFTLRERLRWSHTFADGQTMLIKPEVGYSFKLSEWRYSIDAEWIRHPERRQGYRFTMRKLNSGFSSAFQDVVNEALKARDSVKVDFDHLGLDYYERYEGKAEMSYELATGLMLYGGLTYNYRRPVRHGQRAVAKERLDSIVRGSYVDFSPYLRLVWTPGQYYMYRDRQKLYLDSPRPTFELQLTRGLKHIFGSQSDYGQVELDVHQAIRLDPIRTLSYHLGAGSFFRQKGEYFISYHYFSRSQYPDSWDEHIGGRFNLLDDYWYSSSPTYVQSHLQYESPFLLLHKWKWISRYVIRERIYLSNLFADGKPAYTEAGYGFGNNYFSAAGFCGFTGASYYEVGARFVIVIDQHW